MYCCGKILLRCLNWFYGNQSQDDHSVGGS
jgi:hypothetical protein